MATYSGNDKRLKFLFEIVSNMASEYSNASIYAVGAYAIYQGILYKCITAVTVAEDFDPTKWTQVLVMNEIGSGGGGGSTVTITPTLSSGTKIADYSINGVAGELYAPNGGGGGVRVYSTSEQIVGTWVDGSNVYEQTHEVTITTTLGAGIHDIVNKPNIRLIDYEGFGYGISNQRCYPLPYSYGTSTTIVAYNLNGNGYINLRINNDSWSSAYKFWITTRYLKLT